MSNWIEITVKILGGLMVVIPLVVQLVKAVRAYVQEKNWPQLLSILLDMMKQAETMFATGADRKEWVMAEMESAALSINYNYDDAARQRVSDMIDAVCAAAKEINR